MPRILICNESISSGGIGTFTLSIARTLRQRGWEVGFVVTHGPGEYFGMMQKIASVCLDLSPMRLGWRKLDTLLTAIDGFSPDVMLLNHCSLAHYLLPFLPQRCKPVAVLHSDQPLFCEIASLFQSRIFRWIAPTRKLNDAFRGYLPRNLHERVRTIPHGVDERIFCRRLAPGASRRIVFIGHVGANKGADLLPEIFRRIASRLSDVCFEVVGAGTLVSSIRREIEDNHMSVVLCGSVSHETVAGILAEADILLLPSRVEGFGLVIVEAMMSGAVPVVSRLAGVTDTIVSDRETGMLVEVDDVEGFASAVVELFSDPERLASMKRAARKVALDKFSLQRMVDDYERLLAEADRRSVSSKRGLACWFWDLLREMARLNPDGSYRVQRKIGTIKQLLVNLCAGRV